MALLALACVPALALAIDRWWGEPPVPLHPVVWMGRALGWCGERIAPRAPQARDLKAFWLGALAWCGLAAIVLIVSAGVQCLLWQGPVLIAVAALALLLKPLLAWRMLREEVLAVEAALAQSLPAGRARLAHLVSRD